MMDRGSFIAVPVKVISSCHTHNIQVINSCPNHTNEEYFQNDDIYVTF